MFVWGLFALTLAGALLPLDVGQRHREHVVLTITATAELAILGPRGLLLVWGAVAAALVVSAGCRRATVDGALGMLITATAVTVGFSLAYATYVGALGRQFPVELTGSRDTAVAGLVLVVAWLGTMSVRTAAHGLAGRAAGGHGLDPFDSSLVAASGGGQAAHPADVRGRTARRTGPGRWCRAGRRWSSRRAPEPAAGP